MLRTTKFYEDFAYRLSAHTAVFTEHYVMSNPAILVVSDGIVKIAIEIVNNDISFFAGSQKESGMTTITHPYNKDLVLAASSLESAFNFARDRVGINGEGYTTSDAVVDGVLIASVIDDKEKETQSKNTAVPDDDGSFLGSIVDGIGNILGDIDL